MFLQPHQTKWVFAVKSYVVVPSLFATVGWAVAKAGGSAHFDELAVSTVGSSALGWGFMRALQACISNGMSESEFLVPLSTDTIRFVVLPPLVNIADLARYADRPSQTNTIAYGLLISKPIVILLGMVVASCSKHLFGTAYWNLCKWKANYFARVLRLVLTLCCCFAV
jgi:NCS1 family nucleobase:cation symporter-1